MELGIVAWGQKTSDGTTGPREKFADIFSRLDKIHQRDGQTDGRMDEHNDLAYERRAVKIRRSLFQIAKI